MVIRNDKLNQLNFNKTEQQGEVGLRERNKFRQVRVLLIALSPATNEATLPSTENRRGCCCGLYLDVELNICLCIYIRCMIVQTEQKDGKPEITCEHSIRSERMFS